MGGAFAHTPNTTSPTHPATRPPFHPPKALCKFASLYARDTRVTPRSFATTMPLWPPETEAQLRRAEEAYRVRAVGAALLTSCFEPLNMSGRSALKVIIHLQSAFARPFKQAGG